MEAGNLNIAMDNDNSQVHVDGLLYLDGGDLNLDLSNYKIDKDTNITLITADKLQGKFDNVTADGYKVTVTYRDNSVVAHIKAK